MHLSSIQLACVALVAVALGAAAPPTTSHHVARRAIDFNTVGCKGINDAANFAVLDRVCEDCYDLFKDTKVYTLCSNDCFTTEYFPGCVEVLYLEDNKTIYEDYIRHLHGAPPEI